MGGTRLTRDGESIFHHLGVSGFATHAVVDRRSVTRVDSDVPPDIAAVLGCAVLTGGGAVINAAQPRDGDTVIVVGLGGVGMAALITAISLGRGDVVGVDALPAKLERATALGASAIYTPTKAVEHGVKAPIVIEAAGNAKAFETAVTLTAAGGSTTTVGLPAPTAYANVSPLGLGSAVPARDIPAYAQLWRDGCLPVEELISSRTTLDDINEAMDDLADGTAIRQIIEFDCATASSGKYGHAWHIQTTSFSSNRGDGTVPVFCAQRASSCTRSTSRAGTPTVYIVSPSLARAGVGHRLRALQVAVRGPASPVSVDRNPN